MTSHELARQLLDGPNLPVLVSVDDQYGYVAQLRDAEPLACQISTREDGLGRMLGDALEYVDPPMREKARMAIVIAPSARA